MSGTAAMIKLAPWLQVKDRPNAAPAADGEVGTDE
jgi:hypothetical protein